MGELHFHAGVMGSNKSAELIIMNYNCIRDSVGVRVIKPAIDTRSRTIKSRALNQEIPCETLDRIKVEDFVNDGKKIILVDEANFLSKEDVDALVILADDYDKIIHAYGLMTDRNEIMFSGAKALIEVGAIMHWLDSKCRVVGCVGHATHQVYFDPNTHLPIFGGAQVLIGDDCYKSVCRKHYNFIKRTLPRWENVKITRFRNE